MKKLYTIGEVSKIKEITIKALRYYNKVGILIPKYIDGKNGYRYYSIDQFLHIDIIKTCRDLGTSIEDLQHIFKNCNTDDLLELLKVKRREAEENIIKMKDIINNIDILNEGVENSRDILNNHEISIKNFPQRHIITIPYEEEGSLKEVLYYSNLDKVIKEKKLRMSVERGIIYDFDEGYVIKPKYVFNGIRDKCDLSDTYGIKILPKGNYLTLGYSKEDEDDSFKSIVNYIIDNKLKIRNIIEIELLNDIFNIDAYSCQIQIYIDDDDF
ncbi:MAG: MerR family transcriptional regulator [Terrisporobacter sp.]|uniref:MerR family transcriptional regulator n=1 Tax=Terrisporobacter sp. TaxID=1965305 RepID=UPI002FCBCB58